MSKIRTHYDNLQLTRNASPEVIRAAYKGLTQRYHPDRNPHDRARCERIMKIINRAFEVLSDPQQRAAHDVWIAAQEAAVQAEAAAQAATAKIRHPTEGRSSPSSATDYSAATRSWHESRVSATAQDEQTHGDASATSQPQHKNHGHPMDRNGYPNQKASARLDRRPDLSGQKGLLFALIAVLQFGPILTGLILNGWINSVKGSIIVEFAHEWPTMKVQLWGVWGIAAAAYFIAGLLLETRLVRSTRWMAAGLLWAGAIVAPLAGMIFASNTLSAPLVSALTGDYVLRAIRSAIFALLCTLYLIFSRRVRNTYPAQVAKDSATPKERAPQAVRVNAQ